MEYVIRDNDAALLLIILGYASSHASMSKDDAMATTVLKFANRINEGNPNWVPYEVKE